MYYIDSIATSETLKKDVKVLIPDTMLRRRMSSLVKRSVATAMECLLDVAAGGESGAKATKDKKPDAIITATTLGFLEDSEKFLKNIFENNEELLNPTPFIQSTFNTVGAQIAILTGNQSYNMTYSQRADSFADALIDAFIRIGQHNAKSVLVGAFDEKTPTFLDLIKHLRLREPKHEGAVFMLISKEKSINTLAGIDITSLISSRSQTTACSALDTPFEIVNALPCLKTEHNIAVSNIILSRI
ncbi:MAG: beta-ketoacyl synthase chain length factor [Bacteroidales bacterium]|jgi:hypothetical protein|nr:beta-ketoacyl synthase chain length factor [Bacteroidales bacterium]